MMKILSTATAFLVALTPAIVSAEPTEQRSFRFDGQTYSYTVEMVGEDKVLRGQIINTQQPFELRVGEKRVSGNFNGNPVSFTLKSVKRLRGIVVLEEFAKR